MLYAYMLSQIGVFLIRKMNKRYIGAHIQYLFFIIVKSYFHGLVKFVQPQTNTNTVLRCQNKPIINNERYFGAGKVGPFFFSA